ncbi:MAG UNVERIFIED_CONTAM: hypothetical protein LVT10_14910 [Anaerolineae bacterium]
MNRDRRNPNGQPLRVRFQLCPRAQAQRRPAPPKASALDTLFTVDDVLKSERSYPHSTWCAQPGVRKSSTLRPTANQWFIKELILETKPRVIYTWQKPFCKMRTAAVPLTTEQIVHDIGGIGQEALPLQALR